MRVTVIGAGGFVGSAFVRLLEQKPDVELIRITRQNFGQLAGTKSDVTIEAACNSKKYLAEQNPLAEFEASVTHRIQTLLRFPADLHVHISSVDVYSDLTSPATTREDTPIDLTQTSTYGTHKYLAELLVRHHAPRWLILRLAGMVGPGLRKNPIYDLLNNLPLRVHPDSSYQYMHTDDVARVVWNLAGRCNSSEVLNVCGDGTVTVREIAELAGCQLNWTPSSDAAAPRIVDACNQKLKHWATVPGTAETVKRFVRATPTGGSSE